MGSQTPPTSKAPETEVAARGHGAKRNGSSEEAPPFPQLVSPLESAAPRSVMAVSTINAIEAVGAEDELTRVAPRSGATPCPPTNDGKQCPLARRALPGICMRKTPPKRGRSLWRACDYQERCNVAIRNIATRASATIAAIHSISLARS